MSKSKALTPKKERTLEQIKKIAIFMLENPEMDRREIAESFGMTYDLLCERIRDSQILSAIKGEASKAILGMIPLAVKGFRDSLTTKNEKIKYFASKDLLQTENILGPGRVDVTINDNSHKTIEELQEMIRQGQRIPPQTIDAEVIS